MKFLYFFLQNRKLTNSSCFGRENSIHLEELTLVRFVRTSITFVFDLLQGFIGCTIQLELEEVDVVGSLDDAVHPSFVLLILGIDSIATHHPHESNEKLYFGDIGLRNLIAGGERGGDIEKIIENIIYQQLLRMGYTVSVGQLRAGEVDFVCTQSNKRIYVQVAYLIASPETEEREFGFGEHKG